MNPISPIELARFKYALLGPLLSRGQNLVRGEQTEFLNQLSKKPITFPGESYPRTVSRRTLMRWLSQLRAEPGAIEPAQSLLREPRKDLGVLKSLTVAQRDWLRSNHDQYPKWSYVLHAQNLKYTGLQPLVSTSTVYRWMKSEGLRPLLMYGGIRKNKETLSFESEFSGQLYHFDFHTGSRQVLGSCGTYITPKCIAFIDDRSRACLHIQWFTSETTEDAVHAIMQCFLKYGVCHKVMSDNGSAMISAEFERGLRVLGVKHEKTIPRSPYQNGKIESFWGPLEKRLMAMLTKVKPLSLQFLNEASVAWVEQDYNVSIHSETKEKPKSLWFSNSNVSKNSPSSDDLRRMFRRRVTRKQRHEDHTLTLENVRYQLPELVFGLDTLTLTYARWNRDLVSLIDPKTERELVDIHPVDLRENSKRRMRTEVQDASLVENKKAAKSESAPLPPFLAHLLEQHRKSWTPNGVLPKPTSHPFPEKSEK